MDNNYLWSVLIGMNTLSGLLFYNIICKKIESFEKRLAFNRSVDEILYTRIIELEKRIDKLENFNLKLLEKKLAYSQNREWDSFSSDFEDDEVD